MIVYNFNKSAMNSKCNLKQIFRTANRPFNFIPFVILIPLFLFSSCKSELRTKDLPVASDWPDAGSVYLKLFQGGITRHLSDGGKYRIKRTAFSLLFPLREYSEIDSKYYNARILCSTEKKIHSISTGENIENPNGITQYFARGTGLSTAAGGKYDAIHITDFPAHHYIIYNRKNQMLQRADAVKKIGDGHFEVMFDVRKIGFGEKEIPVENTKLNSLFLTIFIDANLDKRIDRDELFRISLEFE